MIKTIHVEPIKNRDKYLSTPMLTKAEVEKAMDHVVAQTRLNMEYFAPSFLGLPQKARNIPSSRTLSGPMVSGRAFCGCAMSTPGTRRSASVQSRTSTRSCIA